VCNSFNKNLYLEAGVIAVKQPYTTKQFQDVKLPNSAKSWMDGESVWSKPQITPAEASPVPTGLQMRYVESRLKQFTLR
jgi:hypothetical protein